MKKAVFLDIDGTLIDCFAGLTDITPKVKEVIRNLQSKGDYVFIATGRPYAFLSKEIRDFGFDGFVLANGAHVMIDGRTIHSKPMNNDFVQKLVSKLEQENIQYVLEGEKYSYVKNEHEELHDFYDSIGMSKQYFKREYNLEELDIHKVEMLCPSKDTMDKCVDFIDRHPEYGYFSSINQIHLELYFKESTKAAGILKALEYINVPIENTYAFGDGENDIEMLSTVGCGIAMGNAHDKVKQYAKEVTDTVHNDGVALGIEKYILNKVL